MRFPVFARRVGLLILQIPSFAAPAALSPDTAQKPLLSPADDDGHGQQSLPGWQLNFSSSAPHLFASTYSLLQQWSNTMFPNGHTLAAVEVPPYTLFYHGRLDGELPPSPEWLAFDVEMSYGIMGSTRDSWLLTYQTAARPVRALYFDGESAALMGLGQLDTQMLHVFGNVSGPPRPRDGGFRGLWQEYARAEGLCDWLLAAGLRGPGWGFEGIVRMNAGFEMIWCDFTSPSLRLLTRLNITAPQLPEDQGNGFNPEREGRAEDGGDRGEGDHDGTPAWLAMRQRGVEPETTSYYSLPPAPTRTDRAVDPSQPPAPPNWRRDMRREPFLKAQGWGWFDSATWHYGSSRNGPGLGETRAKVLGCGVLSYYSPRFVNQSGNRAIEERAFLNLTDDGLWKGEGDEGNRTQAIKLLSRRRRFHHLGAVTTEEAELMRSSSEPLLRSLLNEAATCTGADWTLITSEIVQRTTKHLTTLSTKFAALPSDSGNKTAVRDWMAAVRAETHLFLMPFLQYPSEPQLEDWKPHSRLFNETYSRCRYRYTRLIAPAEGVALVPEEEDLRWATEETYGTVCAVLGSIGFEVERTWKEVFETEETHSGEEMEKQVTRWQDNIAELSAWVGWESEFVGCKEVCAWDERCYIPMWPLLQWRGNFGGGRPRNGTGPPYRGGRHQDPSAPHGPPPDGPPPPNGSHFPPPPGNGSFPDFKMPPRGPWWMGNDEDLWEPKCVKQGYIMGE